MAHRLQDFKTTLKGGGARPNLFEVSLTMPSGVPSSTFIAQDFSILCKSAALPASNIASIDVPFRGRIFKVAGDRTFDTWTVTVINDQDFEIRNAMELWMQAIGQYSDASGYTSPGDYMTTANVKQLKRGKSNTGFGVKDGTGLEVAANYQFYDIFPTNVSAIDLSYDTSDTIEEFTVEFQVQYWVPLGANSESAPQG